MDEITRCYRLVKDIPPLPTTIMASEKVPIERTFRQWDTSGRLLLWINTERLLGITMRPSVMGQKMTSFHGEMEIMPVHISLVFTD